MRYFKASIIVLLISFGSFSVWRAVPNIWAEFAKYQEVGVEARVDGIAVAPDTTRARWAAERAPTGRRWLGYAKRLLREAASSDSRRDRRALLRHGYHAARAALRRAPAQPEAWFLVAYLGRINGLPPVRQCEAWRYSVLLGPYERRLVEVRALFAIRHLRNCPAASRHLDGQIDWMWGYDRGDLVRVAGRDAEVYRRVFEALSEDPEKLRQFVEDVARGTI